MEIIDLILHVFSEHLLLTSTLALFVIGFLFYIFKTAAFLAFASQVPGYSAFAKLFGAINRKFKLSIFDRVRDGILRRRKRLKEEKEEKKKKKQQQEDPDKELNDALRAEQQQRQMEREGVVRQIPLPELAPLERREQVRQEISAERLAEQRRDAAKLVQESLSVKASPERQEERRVQLDERRHTSVEISPSLFVGMKVPELLYNELSHSRHHSHHHLPQSLLSMLHISTPLQSLDLVAKAAIVAHVVATHNSGQQHSGNKPEKAPSDVPKVTLAQTSLSNTNATQSVDKPKTHIPDFVKNFQAKADAPAHNR